jgi:hypothetical protein
MFVRIVHFLLGAVLAGGGGYLAWTYRSGGMNVFPPATSMPWLVIAGVMGLCAGVVLLVNAVHPRPNRRARLAAQAATREATLGAAETYYSERGRAADRDWRTSDIPAPATPAPVAEAVRAAAPPAPALPQSPPLPSPPSPIAPPPVKVEPAATVAAKPVATSAPPEAVAPTPFPSAATLAPIPVAAEPPPAPKVEVLVAPPVAETPAAAPVLEEPVTAPAPDAPMVVAGAPTALRPMAPAPTAPLPAAPAPAEPVAAAPVAPFAAIRAALAAGRLDDAEKLLNAGRETAHGLELAELTGLAGDHAAAVGRASNAKWLWRLALKRFGELGAMDTQAARAVAESLRVTV